MVFEFNTLFEIGDCLWYLNSLFKYYLNTFMAFEYTI